ncbi:MAG TPA: 3-dehydroquinate synthase [Candidatus Limnocylindria bacterium]|nr:3-dehydroquinate synthase [Candidatus Limnocylindria bacterium]
MHLFLVGPPGVGKTTVAALLAAALGARALDLDDEIGRRAGKACSAVISDDGMPRFRALEAEALARLRPTPALIVVSTGGGAVLLESSRRAMQALGLRVGLTGSVATVTRGIERTMAKRAHLALPVRDYAARVLRERRREYADVDATFPVDRLEPREVALAIAAWLVAARGLRVDVRIGRTYPVLVRAGLLEHVGMHLADLGWSGPVALVADSLTARRFGPAVRRSCAAAGLTAHVILVPRGERAKRLDALGRLWDALGAARIGRDGGVVALGGGTVGDLAGFAAATYLRGVRVAQVPTTLLAMVDSSIGGKTGIDLPGGKNLAGAFHQPDAVLADPVVLATLPTHERSSGLAEIVKCAFLSDRDAVAQVERSVGAVLAGDLGPTFGCIALASAMKAGVVGEDERERGVRELLNFGHTLGHAYEAASGYRVMHGEAVSVGMVFASVLAERLDLVAASFRQRLEAVLTAGGLPTRARLPVSTWDHLRMDKKVRDGQVRWILPRAIGRFSEVTDVTGRTLRAAAAVVEGR